MTDQEAREWAQRTWDACERHLERQRAYEQQRRGEGRLAEVRRLPAAVRIHVERRAGLEVER